MSSEQEYILERVQQVPWSGCWLWDRNLDPCGYGRFGKVGTKEVLAHRYAYLVFVGSIPKGVHVCHTCDIPACCNPDHLFLGSAKDNAVDCSRKGRRPSTLSAEDVLRIRTLVDSGLTQREVAVTYGVSYKTISKIVRRQRWAWLEESQCYP